jgi:glycosyltransferase involved in cell wall biosynthesis
MRSISLARQLVRLNHEVTLVASRARPGCRIRHTLIDGVDQFEMPDFLPGRVRHGGLSPVDLAFRSMWISARRFDVIHTFEHRPAVIVPALIGRSRAGSLFVSDWADLWGREGIAALRGSPLEKLLGRADGYFELQVRRRADGVTAISTDLFHRLEMLGISETRRMILPPGANLDLITPVDKVATRGVLGLPPAAIIVAFSGYAPYDQEFISQAILDLLRLDRQVLVISTGNFLSPPALSMQEAGWAGRVIQFGSLPLAENGVVLGAADVLLLPYLDKPINRGRFPNKFGDFLATGRPIVSHRTGDLGRIIEGKDFGLLSSEEPEEFARDVLNLAHSDADLERMGMNARRFAEQDWSWRLRAEQVRDFYLSLRP